MKASPLCRILSILTLALLLTASDALAMTFSQPVDVGKVIDYADADYGYNIVNATATDATRLSNKKGIGGPDALFYTNGISRFGSGEDAIYFHYRGKERTYGGKELRDTFPFKSLGCNFFKIETDTALTLYMAYEWQVSGEGNSCNLLGRRSDGRWVKYFDTREITQRYFGDIRQRVKLPYYARWYVYKDSIVVVYKRNPSNRMSNFVDAGEFRFHWDDNAQWFSVEHVLY
ncbi:hypothetical protein [uncultured Selenomonas sp.]|uniref:hypothetical protein n=1 Tax=uncultured Selenomonas sp. TaxID=159275 RepID=UPI0025D98FFC|nr:hypothetical protein [uncultured Selenomonas sp.]